MSNPDWANMKFNMNNSDSDDEDEQRRQAEEEAQRQAEEEAQRQAEVARQNRLLEIQRKMFTDVGIDPSAPYDTPELDAELQARAEQEQQEQQEQQEHQRIQILRRQAELANLLPGNQGRFTVDDQGIKYDRGRRMNGGKRRRKTRRRTRKSRKSKKSKKSRRYRK
jgi:hypothetical protein